MNKTWLLVFSLILLSGCSSTPELTRDEFASITTREYPGLTGEQVLQASEKLFRLADGDDFKFNYSRDNPAIETIYATRKWTEYLVFSSATGFDYWKLTTVSGEQGTIATIQLNRHIVSKIVWTYRYMNPPIPAHQWPEGEGIKNTSIYDLYWARMDYLLGEREDWMTCKMSKERIKLKVVWGDNDFLCNFLNLKDDIPDSPLIVSNLESIYKIFPK